jgi:hypothetical protein
MTQKKAAPKKAAKKKGPKKPPIHPPAAAPGTESEEQYGRAMDEIIQYGDVASLTVPQRSEFLYKLALSMGLNPLSQPFELIMLNGKLTIYAKRTAADQLRQKHKITSEVISEGPLKIGEQERDDVYCVKVRLMAPDKMEGSGVRTENAIGCVGIAGLSDEALANAIMKCHTKALRRGTLSFCGLGFLDEIEVSSVQEAAASPGVGSPRRMIPRITPSPQPAGGSAKPIVIPGTQIPNDPAAAKPVEIPNMKEGGEQGKVQTTVPTVLPPVTPPVTIPKKDDEGSK